MTVNKTYIGKASPRIRIINSNCYSSTNHQAKGIQKLKGLSLGPYCQNTRTTSLCFSFFRATLSGLDTFHLHLLLLFLCPASPNSVICLHKKKEIYLPMGQRECMWRQKTTFLWVGSLLPLCFEAAGALKRASGQGSHLQLLPYRDKLGIQMHSTAPGFHVGQEGWTQAAGFS